MEWVNISDKLPENDERVVLYTPYDFFGKDHSCIGDKQSITTCNAMLKGKTVPVFTHWMPLPEGPEVKEHYL
ncbi:MAG: DUF551 domain-containing protein [Desulfuromonadaceae bacterium]|nr:DUF551 domain-containing protein [Desulfuromonadaceae bacterium]